MYSYSPMRIAVSISICLALVLGCAIPSRSQTGSQRVDGRNVTWVEVDGRIFQLLPFARWTESGGGTTFEFVEERRDEWSVYLLDGTRDVTLQLDLKQMQVFYSEGSSPKRPLYGIMSASADVTARNVSLVRVKGGEFRMTEPKRWDETASDGASFNFVEAKRDDGSVYLTDASRGVRIQLDLSRKQVYYAEDGSKQRPLYPITGVSAISWN
jgi:hypothetical protein